MDYLELHLTEQISQTKEAIERFTSYAQNHADNAIEFDGVDSVVVEISQGWVKFYTDKAQGLQKTLSDLQIRLEQRIKI